MVCWGGKMNIINWPGSKKRLLAQIVKYIPQDIDTYIEPFVGSGVVFIYLLFNSNINNFIIGDLNPDIYFLWEDIKNNVDTVYEYYEDLREKYVCLENRDDVKRMYNSIRKEFNNIAHSPYRTSLFILLSNTCMNGLWRTNKSGYLNQTCGTKKPIKLEYDELSQLSSKLKDVHIWYGDYHGVIPYVKSGAFVYLDPPYKQAEKTNDVKYVNGEIFTDDDQVSLKKFCDKIIRCGGHFLQSNSDCKFFDDLYSDYDIFRVDIKINVSANRAYRKSVKEILISG